MPLTLLKTSTGRFRYVINFQHLNKIVHMCECLTLPSSLTCWQRDDRVKFFCLQVLEHHVRSRHASSSDDDILALRKLLMAWIQLRHQEVDQSEVRKRRVVECVLGLGGAVMDILVDDRETKGEVKTE